MEEKTFFMYSNVFMKYAHRQMPTLKISCTSKICGGVLKQYI